MQWFLANVCFVGLMYLSVCAMAHSARAYQDDPPNGPPTKVGRVSDLPPNVRANAERPDGGAGLVLTAETLRGTLHGARGELLRKGLAVSLNEYHYEYRLDVRMPPNSLGEVVHIPYDVVFADKDYETKWVKQWNLAEQRGTPSSGLHPPMIAKGYTGHRAGKQYILVTELVNDTH